MKQILALLLLLPVLLVLRLLGLGRRDMVFLKEDHPDMKAAFQKAQETLPHFLARLQEGAGTAKDFALKVRFSLGSGSEHIWVDQVEYQDGKFNARIANDPNDIPDIKLGDKVSFPTVRVSDWAYAVDGVFHGHYTTRALLRHMSRGMQKKTRAMLGWEAGEPTL